MWNARYVIASIVLAACGPGGRGTPQDGKVDAKPDAPCPTALTGKVFAPNGTLPLYNVNVYVPLTDPLAFTPGIACEPCTGALPGGVIAKTLTDSQGAFRLEGVPTDRDFEVILATGKWRRRLMVSQAQVSRCVDNPITDGTFRLPKNHLEGEMPRIAVVTGGCDALGCILSKLGIDGSEFGDRSSGNTAVVFFNGDGGSAPGAPQPAPVLWNDLNELKKFDVVMNTCECSESNQNKTAPDVLRQYADAGGRILGSHYHYTWMKNLIPAWSGMADWTSGSTATPDLVDMSFPKGNALAEWLLAVGASTTLGQVPLGTKTYNASTVHGNTSRWLYSSGTPATTHYLSFNTPVGVPPEQQCGKVVYAGLHVASGFVDSSFPAGCSASFTPDEKALAFLLFDLQTCVDVVF